MQPHMIYPWGYVSVSSRFVASSAFRLHTIFLLDTVFDVICSGRACFQQWVSCYWVTMPGRCNWLPPYRQHSLMFAALSVFHNSIYIVAGFCCSALWRFQNSSCVAAWSALILVQINYSIYTDDLLSHTPGVAGMIRTRRPNLPGEGHCMIYVIVTDDLRRSAGGSLAAVSVVASQSSHVRRWAWFSHWSFSL